MSERLMADAFDRWLRSEGLVFRRDRMDKATTCARGWPDFEIIQNSRVLMLELKTEKGRLSRDQINLHRRLSETGTAVHVCRTLEAACELVNAWRGGEETQTGRKDDGLRRFGAVIMQPVLGERTGLVIGYEKLRPYDPAKDQHIPLLK